MARARVSTAQSVPDDFISVDQIRIDLRLEDDGFDDETLSRYRDDAIALVARLTGCPLLSLTVGEIDKGIRHAVSVAVWTRFETTAEIPPALLQLCARYRQLLPVSN